MLPRYVTKTLPQSSPEDASEQQNECNYFIVQLYNNTPIQIQQKLYLGHFLKQYIDGDGGCFRVVERVQEARDLMPRGLVLPQAAQEVERCLIVRLGSAAGVAGEQEGCCEIFKPLIFKPLL